eukprot:9837462-Heterocapsa_arctica.AAC.1
MDRRQKLELVHVQDGECGPLTTQMLLTGGVVHKGKHSDLWNRTNHHLDKLISNRWVKAHLKVEKAQAAGVSYDDWLGNDHADKQAKEGAEKHGYTDAQTYAIKLKISLVQRIQKHMIFTCLKYSKNLLVREDSEENKKVEGTKT